MLPLDNSLDQLLVVHTVTRFRQLQGAERDSLGAVDYLLMPFVPDILRAKVAVFVDLFRQRVP